MAQNERNEIERPNRSSGMDPAEGSREAVRGGEQGGGITNRGLEQEREEQHVLPERGRSKSESRDRSDRSESER